MLLKVKYNLQVKLSACPNWLYPNLLPLHKLVFSRVTCFHYSSVGWMRPLWDLQTLLQVEQKLLEGQLDRQYEKGHHMYCWWRDLKISLLSQMLFHYFGSEVNISIFTGTFLKYFLLAMSHRDIAQNKATISWI